MTNKTMIVPLDGSEMSERAIAVALSLSSGMGADLLLVSAPYGGPLDVHQYLEEKAAAVRGAGFKVAVQAGSNHPVEAIMHAAAEVDDPIVCMTTHGGGRLRWATLGSTAEDLLRRIDRPSVLVGRNCRADFLARSSRMIACVDGTDTSEHLAPTASEFAALLGLEIGVAIVVHPLDVVSAERENDMLQELRAPFGPSSHATMLTNRYVAGAIADYADGFPAALVAMNTQARGGLSRFALGSTTMGVVHLVGCPVLVAPRNRGADAEGEGEGFVVTGAGR